METKDEKINNEPQIGHPEHKPIAAFVIGMAGSGKSTLMQRINSYVNMKKYPSYIINLDPAVNGTNDFITIFFFLSVIF